jgi:N-acetylglutamate synthase-like GNAT family acetyltransferase
MIRQFQHQDAASCSRLIHACLENDSSYSFALREKIRRLETSQAMVERARLFYVAVYEAEDEILGVAGLDMNEIRLLCVSPEHRRLGIGCALLKHIKAMVPGFLFSDIFVYSSRQAAQFYLACGFAERGPFAFDLSGEQLMTIFMTYAISYPNPR